MALSVTMVGVLGYQIYQYFSQNPKMGVKNIREEEYTPIYSPKQLKKIICQMKKSHFDKLCFQFHPTISDKDRIQYSQIFSCYITFINANQY